MTRKGASKAQGGKRLRSYNFSVDLNLRESKAGLGLSWLGQDNGYFVLAANAGALCFFSGPGFPIDIGDDICVIGAVQANLGWLGDWCRNAIDELGLLACSCLVGS